MDMYNVIPANFSDFSGQTINAITICVKQESSLGWGKLETNL
jgi:hypothetical protein